MGSLAVLAKEKGLKVSGSDANVYPPMSTQLKAQDIEIMEGYNACHLKPSPDLVIIGNALSRGNVAVEYVIEEGLPYVSGPQWLAENVLCDKWVLGVAGTHGKTTTSAILAWILEFADLKPGFLIGGVTNNFANSARLGDSQFFVVEADEYDSAFFDKRSKFVHYCPRTAVLNNLEFDHADIFNNLEEIEKQFHHLIRTIPGSGTIISPYADLGIEKVIGMGCWSNRQHFGVNFPDSKCKKAAFETGIFWNAEFEGNQGNEFQLVKYEKKSGAAVKTKGLVKWSQNGKHNVKNALAAVAAANQVGVDLSVAVKALENFEGVKRRMELRGTVSGINVYDDFAHHPTAIQTTLDGFAAKLIASKSTKRVVAVIEPRSVTMKSGVHQEKLSKSCLSADEVVWYKRENMGLDFELLTSSLGVPSRAFDSVDDIVTFLTQTCNSGDNVIIMSNGGFEGIHDKLLTSLSLVRFSQN